MSWRLWKETGLVADKPTGKILILSTGFGAVALIVEGGYVQRSVPLSTSPTRLSSTLLPYAPKPSRVYFYFANITFCDIHLCICCIPSMLRYVKAESCCVRLA